jgi:hypothetical protein
VISVQADEAGESPSLPVRGCRGRGSAVLAVAAEPVLISNSWRHEVGLEDPGSGRVVGVDADPALAHFLFEVRPRIRASGR